MYCPMEILEKVILVYFMVFCSLSLKVAELWKQIVLSLKTSATQQQQESNLNTPPNKKYQQQRVNWNNDGCYFSCCKTAQLAFILSFGAFLMNHLQTLDTMRLFRYCKNAKSSITFISRAFARSRSLLRRVWSLIHDQLVILRTAFTFSGSLSIDPEVIVVGFALGLAWKMRSLAEVAVTSSWSQSGGMWYKDHLSPDRLGP